MSRLAWAITVLLTILLLPAAVAGVALAVIDPNALKPEIVRAVQAATGRAIALNGPLRISWSLWPTFEISDVALANLPGGTRPDIAHAERIEAQLSIPALLRREVEVTKLVLTGPNILFEEVAGQPNWIANPPASAEPAPTGPPAANAAPALTLRIRTVQIRNGMVTWRFPQRTKVVGIRTLELQHPTDPAPYDLTATLVYSDNQPFSLHLSAQPRGAWNDPWATQVAFAAFDTTATATGTADLAGRFDLQVEAKAGALDQLNALLPEMRLPALRQATLSAHLLSGPEFGALPTIGATHLSFATADLDDRVTGLTLGLTQLALTEAGGLATLASTGRFAGQGFKLAGTIGVPRHPDAKVDIPIDLQAQGVSGGDNAPLDADDSLALKGKVALSALRFNGLDTHATLRTPALAALRSLLSPSLPALTNVRFDGRVIIPADAGSIAVKNAKLLSREGDVTGDWTFGRQTALTLSGKLASPRLDLDAMLAAFHAELPPAPQTGPGPVFSTAPLPWSRLRGPAVDLTAKIDAMTFQGQLWRNLDFALKLNNGRLQLAPVTLSLPNGPLRLSLAIDATRDAAPVSLDLHAPGIPLALIGRYAGLPGPMEGAVQLDIQLHGAGQTPHDLAASLDGTVSATLIGGRMTNAAFTQLTAASLEALGITVPAQGDTALRCFGLIGAFTKGVARLRTIALDTTHLQLDGTGQVDLARETLAFKLHPLAQISGSAIAVPVLVEGPFRDPKGRLDADGLDKLGLFIDSLFGSDRSTACADAGLLPATAPR